MQVAGIDSASMSEQPPSSGIRLLVLQATQFCNIDCAYCYLPNRNQSSHMSAEVLAAVRREIIEPRRLATGGLVLWHAGEPLAIGLPRFKELRRALFGECRPDWIREQVQTNATLIDEGWADYLRTAGIMVGVSIDGPAEIHDRRRVTRSGAGTHRATMAGVSALTRAGVDFSIIAVVGEDSLERGTEIFDFLRQLGAKAIGFSIEKIEGANLESSLTAGPHFDRVREFFRAVTAANLESDRPVVIREVEHVLTGLPATAADRPISDEITLGRIVSITRDGRVGFFSPELSTNPMSPSYDEFTFGNLLRESFDDIEDRAARSRLMADAIAGAAACRDSCEFWRFCGGGSPSAKISETGSAATTRTAFCVLSKQAATYGILDAIVDAGVTAE